MFAIVVYFLKLQMEPEVSQEAFETVFAVHLQE